MTMFGKRTTEENLDGQKIGFSGQPPAAGATPPAETRAAARPAAAPASRGAGTTIGASMQIQGELRGEEDLFVEGQVHGTIYLNSNTLTVGGQGRLKADVYAQIVLVDGRIEGNLYGSDQVVVRKNAEVRGNITAPRVSLEDGATFKGSIEMDPDAVKTALGSTQGVRPATTPLKSATPAAASATAGSAPAATGEPALRGGATRHG